MWLVAIYVEYNSTGVYRPPGSGCSTPRTGPASVPSYIFACSAEARHGSSYSGRRIPWGGHANWRSGVWPVFLLGFIPTYPPGHWLHWLHEPRQI